MRSPLPGLPDAAPALLGLGAAAALVVAAAIVLALLHLALRRLLGVTGRLARRAPTRLRGTRAWAALRPWRARVAERHPDAYAAVAARLDPHAFTGLPLTLIVLAALYVAALFGGLVEMVIEAEGVQAFDDRVNGLLGPARLPALVAAFAWITDLGGTAATTAVALTATGFLAVGGRHRAILPLWVTTLGAQITTYAGKYALDRVRPDFATFVTAADPSFPSGHTTAATAVYGFLAYLLARDMAGPRRRFAVVYWMTVLIVLIGFSRAFLSVHFVSDVGAGFLVGLFWLLVGFALAEIRRPAPAGPA